MSLPVVELVGNLSNPFSTVLEQGRCYRLGGTDGHQEFFASMRKSRACRLSWFVEWFALWLALRTAEY